jgi:flavorubredoxin
MPSPYQAIRITDKVYWVGAIDWSVRDFHGYLTTRGTTYNAYLILADQITLVDTVKAPFQDEMLARISSLIDPKQIRLIISNHSEMDHSGCLIPVADLVKPQKIYASAQGVQALDAHFHCDGRIEAVKDGQEISLGNLKVQCFETRMCHWPDSMVSFLEQEHLLISQDIFGMHLATTERFNDEVDSDVLNHEYAKYYANILMPLSGFVAKALDKLAPLLPKVKLIAPDHGPVWRSGLEGAVERYRRWARQQRVNRAVVVYDTMWGSTAKMAQAIGEGLRGAGTPARLMPMSGNHRSDVATALLEAGALVAGAPTINNAMFPSLGDVLTYLRGLRPKGLVGAVFGSYGWSAESIKELAAALAEMKVDLVGEGLKVKYVPDEAALEQCRRLGTDVARRLQETLAKVVT